jgi:hypothetical protein
VNALKRLAQGVRPTLYPMWTAERKLGLPSMDAATLDQKLQKAQASLSTPVSQVQDRQRDMVLLAVEHERQRLGGLEAKGFAVAALPTAVAAGSIAIIGANWASTICGCLVIGYSACALASASGIIVPRPRAMFLVDDALRPDPLSRLVAVTKVNQPVALAVNNRIVAAAWDTLRAFSMLIIGAATLLFNVDLSPGHATPVPTPSTVTSRPMSTAPSGSHTPARSSAPPTTNSTIH